jgi:hypothetical protein
MKLINGSWIQTIAENLFGRKDVTFDNFFHVSGQIQSITASTIYTPPSGKIFMLTDIVISVAGDNDVNIIELNGGTRTIFNFNFNTLANTGLNISHSFSIPFKGDPEGVLQISTTTTQRVNYSLQGYYV